MSESDPYVPRQAHPKPAGVQHEIGEGGVVQITSASGAVTGVFGILHALDDVVFNAVTNLAADGNGSLNGKTLKAGDRVYGTFTSVSVTSGNLEAYKKKQ